MRLLTVLNWWTIEIHCLISKIIMNGWMNEWMSSPPTPLTSPSSDASKLPGQNGQWRISLSTSAYPKDPALQSSHPLSYISFGNCWASSPQLSPRTRHTTDAAKMEATESREDAVGTSQSHVTKESLMGEVIHSPLCTFLWRLWS